MADKKPKKRYSLYRQGVTDTIDEMSRLLLTEVFANDPRANREEVIEKVRYLQNKLKDLIT
jgi:hypothetical protein